MKRTRRSPQPTPIGLVDESAIDPALAETAPQAFEAVRAEIVAIATSQLLPVNLDVPRAAGRGILAAERMRPLLPSLTKLPEFDTRQLENLQTYALALLYCHDLCIEGGLSDEPTLTTLFGEAVPLRESMLRTAELLVHFGFVSADRVALIRSGRGYVEIANGLLALGRLFLELWPRIHDKVLVSRVMVDRAIALGGELHKALSAREIAANPLVQPNDRRHLRAQAFTLFARAHEESRRGVRFLRWYEGDAHHIVPSLYPRRNAKSRRTTETTGGPDRGPDPTPSEADDPNEQSSIPVLIAELTPVELVASA